MTTDAWDDLVRRAEILRLIGDVFTAGEEVRAALARMEESLVLLPGSWGLNKTQSRAFRKEARAIVADAEARARALLLRFRR